MPGEGRNDLKLLSMLLIAAALLLVVIAAVLLPASLPLVATLNDGMGLKQSLPWGFGVTVGLFVLFALVSGDGLIGEVQFLRIRIGNPTHPDAPCGSYEGCRGRRLAGAGCEVNAQDRRRAVSRGHWRTVDRAIGLVSGVFEQTQDECPSRLPVAEDAGYQAIR